MAAAGAYSGLSRLPDAEYTVVYTGGCIGAAALLHRELARIAPMDTLETILEIASYSCHL